MDTRIRVLRRVADIEGSEPALARRLNVRSSCVSAWLTGSEPVPEAVFLRAVDIILDETPRITVVALPDTGSAEARRTTSGATAS